MIVCCELLVVNLAIDGLVAIVLRARPAVGSEVGSKPERWSLRSSIDGH
mgnify:CR=1